MKTNTAILAIILILVIFPLLGSGAFADFIGKGSLPIALFTDPVNLFLLGMGLTFVGSRV